MKLFSAIGANAALFLFLAMPTHAQTNAAPAKPAGAVAVQPAAQGDAKSARPKPLNNEVCPVSDEPVNAEKAKTVVYKGYEISLCCAGCVKKFNKDPDKYLKSALDAEKAAKAKKKGETAAVKPVNNANCPVSGHPVGSMQPGSHIVYKGYHIGLCCDSCKGRFNQNADAYLQAMLNPAKQ